MVKIFSEFSDVFKSRENADAAQDGVSEFVSRMLRPGEEMRGSVTANGVGAVCASLNALRLEIRAAAQTVSSAIGAAVEEWRGEMRGER